jgi:hypothetical protein
VTKWRATADEDGLLRRGAGVGKYRIKPPIAARQSGCLSPGPEASLIREPHDKRQSYSEPSHVRLAKTPVRIFGSALPNEVHGYLSTRLSTGNQS